MKQELLSSGLRYIGVNMKRLEMKLAGVQKCSENITVGCSGM
jgi:hypothetical protein